MLKKKKYSTKLITLNSFTETLSINPFSVLYTKYKTLFIYFFNSVNYNLENLRREQANCVYRDMLQLTIS